MWERWGRTEPHLSYGKNKPNFLPFQAICHWKWGHFSLAFVIFIGVQQIPCILYFSVMLHSRVLQNVLLAIKHETFLKLHSSQYTTTDIHYKIWLCRQMFCVHRQLEYISLIFTTNSRLSWTEMYFSLNKHKLKYN